MNDKVALVLGATGGIGGSISKALIRHGWSVRGMVRKVGDSRRTGPSQVEWMEGDAMRQDDVARAATGASVIVHAVNPPNYMNWEKLVLPMIDNTIEAARTVGARIVVPGTIYNFDPALTPLIDADSPQRPKSRKGAIRVEMERRLESAAPGVSSLILRAGDFFGPGARSSWFSQAMVSPGTAVRRLVNPARGAGHSWAYLPDLAEAFARIIDHPEKLRPFERVQFEGFCDDSGTGIIDALRRVAGRELRAYRFPWWLMRVASPFASFPREAAEIAPYWQYPVRFDNRRLVQLIGPEPSTPLDDAIRASLIDMQCLPATTISGLREEAA